MDLRDQLQAALGDAYTIERELGGGGMSRVFLARETSLERRVVVKVLPEELSGSVSTVRFRREIALAARLQHPHLVPVLMAGEMEGLPYYAMPFVEGDSLRTRLSRGELPVPETISILRDVARALEYAHANGVTHRDIKPDNVMLAGSSAVITDFGVAKALSDATSATTGQLTSIGVALGTPAYMAPEQAAGDPATDHRADLYAFGVMAYEMLAGHPPFAGRSAQAILAAHATEQPTAITVVRPATPPRLAELVMRCLEKRSADRPQSATEILRALDAFATPIAGTRHEPMLPRSLSAVGWRSRRIAIIGTVAFALAGLTAVALWRARSGGTPADAEIRTLAVLPFENTSGDTLSDYLEDGVTDHVRDALNAVANLSVKARSSSMRLKGHDARQVGAALGVGAVLQGTVSRTVTGLHVTAELVRTSNDDALWSGTFDGQPNELLGIQDTIVRAVAGKLRLRPVETQSTSGVASGTRGTTDAEAYHLFLRARFAYDHFDLPHAEALFRAAIARDPRFARAMGFLAMTQANAPVLGVASLDSSLAVARATAERALANDSTVVEASIAESFALASDMRLADAIRPLEKALRIDSTNVDLLLAEALALAQVGRVQDGLGYALRARERDPLYVSAVGITGYLLELGGRYDDAIAASRAAIELDPGNGLGRRGLGFLYVFAGKPDSAVAQLEAGLALDSTAFGARANLVFGYAARGRWADAARQRLLAEREGERSNSPNYYRALVALAFGENAAAMAAFERGVSNREPLFSKHQSSVRPHVRSAQDGPAFHRGHATHWRTSVRAEGQVADRSAPEAPVGAPFRPNAPPVAR